MAQRIHKDFAKLFKAPPPDCILETGDDEGESTEEGTGADALSLSSVTFVLLGPEATAYHGGAWRVRLRVPATYPRAAPAAHFLTRIFHPNVRPDTGEVCVDTLKRDWRADLDLTQVILTIRCLLIQPNPESALNEEAGRLMLDDYAAFERAARVMTRVHALPRAQVLQKHGLEDAPTATTTTMKKIEAPNCVTAEDADVEMAESAGEEDAKGGSTSNKENGGGVVLHVWDGQGGAAGNHAAAAARAPGGGPVQAAPARRTLGGAAPGTAAAAGVVAKAVPSAGESPGEKVRALPGPGLAATAAVAAAAVGKRRRKRKAQVSQIKAGLKRL